MGWLYSQLFVRPPYPSQSFEGQTIIVTGANVGLGFSAARHFARLHAGKIILAVRNIAAGEEAKQQIETSTKRPGCCEVWALDLSSYASAKAFAARADALQRLDIVVQNAALANPQEFALAEGHERHITVNVISTFLLGLLLLPKLQATAKAHPTSTPKMTFVTSEMHEFTRFPERNAPSVFGALDDPKATDMGERYNTSKLVQLLLVREIASRMPARDVIVNMVNPGLCHSQLARDYGWGFWAMKQITARSTEMGSRTLVAGASVGPESHGMYMSDGRVAEDSLAPFVISGEGAEAQRRLWLELAALLEEQAPGCTAVVS